MLESTLILLPSLPSSLHLCRDSHMFVQALSRLNS
jgi:hypothetical protein